MNFFFGRRMAGSLWMVFLLLFGGCATEHPELEQAIKVVRHVSSEKQLKSSSFLILSGEKTPSNFLTWMFSAMGTAEWYVADGPSIEFSPDELEHIKRITPLVPENVAIVADHPDPEKGKQVVVISDDNKNIIVVEGYLDPKEPHVLRKEWHFPELK
ncbi:MAG: hypothetical protein NPINA01_32570 [Nitrospinaceae bacterium]|nr:MAG: hypothetical protein NPINA01_32570 [Nitrospinaceae bacterium]